MLAAQSFAIEYELPHEIRTDYEYDMDIPWRAGHEKNVGYRSGYWGFSYNLDPGQDQSKLQPYYNIETYYDRWNKTIRGPLVEGGQNINTTFGARLGIFYSPYVAYFDDKVLGMRMSGFNWDVFKLGNLMFEGTYIFGYLNGTALWKGPELIDGQGDYALNMKGDLGGIKVNNSALRYYNTEKEQYFNNYSLEGAVDFSRKMNLTGLYAGYEENDDKLYSLNWRWDMVPNLLRLESCLRDSEVKSLSTIRGPQSFYIIRPEDPTMLDPLEEAAFLGHCFNIGPTVWGKIGPTQNMLKLDYATSAKVDFRSTTPIEVPELPRVSLSLSTNYQNFIIQNNYYRLISGQDDRSFYRFGVVAEPSYELPYNLRALVRLDFDFDRNYTAMDTVEQFSLLGLRLYTTLDLWRFKKIVLDSFWMLGLTGEDYEKVDPFKIALMASYNAPNGLRFRLQYFSSADFSQKLPDIFGEDRYDPYRWYSNDLGKTGLRLIMALPF